MINWCLNAIEWYIFNGESPSQRWAPAAPQRPPPGSAPGTLVFTRHVPWHKIKVQESQGPASSIQFRILGSQGPASSIHFRILGSQGPMSSIHFRILGFQGPTSSIPFRIQGSQDPTSGIHSRILGSQGPMTSTHFRIRNPQDPMTSRYALQDTVFPRSHEFMAYHLQPSTFNLSP